MDFKLETFFYGMFGYVLMIALKAFHAWGMGGGNRLKPYFRWRFLVLTAVLAAGGGVAANAICDYVGAHKPLLAMYVGLTLPHTVMSLAVRNPVEFGEGEGRSGGGGGPLLPPAESKRRSGKQTPKRSKRSGGS